MHCSLRKAGILHECFAAERMRKTKEDTELSKRRILDAAEEVFCQVSYSAARVNEMAQMAGMTILVLNLPWCLLAQGLLKQPCPVILTRPAGPVRQR